MYPAFRWLTFAFICSLAASIFFYASSASLPVSAFSFSEKKPLWKKFFYQSLALRDLLVDVLRGLHQHIWVTLSGSERFFGCFTERDVLFDLLAGLRNFFGALLERFAYGCDVEVQT